MKYRKKPVEIEAVQLLNTSASIREVTTFINGKEPETQSAIASGKWDDYVNICNEKGGIYLKTLESDDSVQKADFGDYIIKGVKGEFYPCKPEIFEMTYEKVEDQRQLYCIEVTRELEEPFVFHEKFDHEPTRQEILEEIDKQDIGYDDDYGKFEYYKVN